MSHLVLVVAAAASSILSDVPYICISGPQMRLYLPISGRLSFRLPSTEVQTQDCMPKQSTGWIFSTSHLITHSHRHLRHQSSHLPLVICTIILLYISSKLWLDYDDLIFSEKRLALYPSTRDLYLVFQTSKYVHDYSYNRYRLFLEVRSYIYNFS